MKQQQTYNIDQIIDYIKNHDEDFIYTFDRFSHILCILQCVWMKAFNQLLCEIDVPYKDMKNDNGAISLLYQLTPILAKHSDAQLKKQVLSFMIEKKEYKEHMLNIVDYLSENKKIIYKHKE